jgi:hypothetical protein
MDAINLRRQTPRQGPRGPFVGTLDCQADRSPSHPIGTWPRAACPEAPDQSRPGNPTVRRACGASLGLHQQEDTMSEQVTGDVPQVPAGDPVSVQTPTITHYQQIAENLAKAIDDMLALIPTFVEAHPDTTAFVNRHQSVPLQFIATAVAAVQQNPELQGGTFDATEARDALQFIDAFRPIADRLTAAAKNLNFSIRSRKANAGTGALEVYAIAKRVALNPLSTTVASHVGNLKRDLGRRGPRKGTKRAPGTPTPAPAPGTHAPVPVPTLPVPAVIGGLTGDEQA